MIDKIGRRIYYMYIEKINGPEDVKKLNIEEIKKSLLIQTFYPHNVGRI